jgi:hypothetical protein
MSAAAAALQSAACRALQRRPADSFRRTLFANNEQRFPIQSTTIRRLYSSDCFAKAEPSTVTSIV